MKGRSCLPSDPKIIICICFGAFWICNKMMSYGRITSHFRIIFFAHTRWLFSYYIALLPDARGNMLFIPSATSVGLKKAFQYAKRMLPLFRAIYSTSSIIRSMRDNFLKRGSDNSKRPVNHKYAFGHRCTRKQAKIISKCCYHTQKMLIKVVRRNNLVQFIHQAVMLICFHVAASFSDANLRYGYNVM